MNPLKHCLGLFAVLGNWPNWESYFDLSRRGLKFSFVALLASLLPLWLIAFAVQVERATRPEIDFVPVAVLPFAIVAGLWLLSFSALAYLIMMIFDRMDRTRAWIITRHWAVFVLSLISALAFAAYLHLGLPFAAANGVAFAAYLGLLAGDVRLAQKVAGFAWGRAVLLACVIVAVGLTLIMLSLNQLMGS